MKKITRQLPAEGRRRTGILSIRCSSVTVALPPATQGSVIALRLFNGSSRDFFGFCSIKPVLSGPLHFSLPPFSPQVTAAFEKNTWIIRYSVRRLSSMLIIFIPLEPICSSFPFICHSRNQSQSRMRARRQTFANNNTYCDELIEI